MLDGPEPAALLPALVVVQRDLGDPVDHREAARGIGMRDRIEHDPLAMRAEADEGGAAADRLAPGGAAPHDRAAPMDRRLRRMHLRPDRRVDAVRPDQQRAARLRGRAVGMRDVRRDAAGIVAVAGDAAAEPDRLRSQPLHHLLVQQHVEAAAMHRILRPVVAGETPARLRIDVVAVEPDQRPFPRGQAHLIELALGDPEIVELAHRIGLHIDADAERAHLARRFEHHAGHADLVQRQGRRQSADAAAGDEHGAFRHAFGPIWKRTAFLTFGACPEQAARSVIGGA